MSSVPIEQRLAVSPDEAAQIVSCCRASFYKLLANGTIRAKKQGRRTVILVEELHRYLADLPEMQPTPPS